MWYETEGCCLNSYRQCFLRHISLCIQRYMSVTNRRHYIVPVPHPTQASLSKTRRCVFKPWCITHSFNSCTALAFTDTAVLVNRISEVLLLYTMPLVNNDEQFIWCYFVKSGNRDFLHAASKTSVFFVFF